MSEQAAQQIQVNDTENTEPNEGRGRNKKRHHRRGGHGAGQRSSSPEPAINMDELRNLVELISKSGFTDFEYENEEVRVRLSKGLAPQIIAAQPAQTSASQMQISAAPPVEQVSQPATQQSVIVPHPGAQAEAEAAEDENLHKITSPIIGTFYRSSSPTAEPFVKIGSHVSPDSVVCIVEAMKLMNEIQAEVSGEVVKIYVENGQPIEYGQPLFGIKK